MGIAQHIKDKHDKISKLAYVDEIINGINSIILITNENREVVFINNFTIKRFNIKDESEYLGLKIGNFFKCVHSDENETGCGTTESCAFCGANNVFTKSIKNNETLTSEFRVIVIKNNATASLDLQITANPMQIEDETYCVLSINDISDKKRKAALERTFFHDIMNTTGGLKAFVEYLKVAENIGESKELIHEVDELTERLIDEINSQRILLSAENDAVTLPVF